MSEKTKTRMALHLDSFQRKGDEFSQFYIRLRIGLKYHYFKTGEWMHEEYWVEKKVKEVKANVGHEALIRGLTEAQARMGNNLNILSVTGQPITERTVRNLWEHTEENNLIGFCEYLLTKDKGILKESTLDQHRKFINNLKGYDSEITLQQVTPDWLDGLGEWLRTKKEQSNNTALSHFWYLGKVFNLAMKKNIIPRNPIRDMDKRIRYKAPDITFLESEEIEILYKAYIEETFLSERFYTKTGPVSKQKATTLHNVLQQVLVSILTGLRYSDLKKLGTPGKYQVTQTHLSLTMKKTEKPLRLFMSERLKTVLNLKPNQPLLHSPVYSNAHSNTMLREVCTNLGITKLLHVHCLRHTFVTDMLTKGAKIERVQRLVGHEDLATTQRYTHVIDKDLDETMKLQDTEGVTPDEKIAALLKQISETLQSNPEIRLTEEAIATLQKLVKPQTKHLKVV